MAEESAQERTEEPTLKRRLDARKKGQVPRSKELNTTLSLLAGGLGMSMFGPTLIEDIKLLMQSGLKLPREAAFDAEAPMHYMAQAIGDAALFLAPLLVLMLFSTVIGPIGMGGLNFSPQALAPKMERISPLKGLGRIFALRSLVELSKTILKFLLVASAAIGILWQLTDWLTSLSQSPLQQSLPDVGYQFIWTFLMLSSTMIIVALIDVPFQLWDHNRKLRMSRQEIKDEMKETEGRPEVKSQIRNLQQQAAQQRMMQEVPTADVIITNPTHFAVALRYVDGQMGAPIVVAKGRDAIAKNIRTIAGEHGITIFSAPPLARALHASCDLGREIPPHLFIAVAKVLAYVFKLRTVSSVSRPGVKPPAPELLIPAEETDGTVNSDGSTSL